ncbi:MAG: YidC/Oxa1 family membrane protein insertase [Ruminococcaceae bacterium]|nr:YidC/Oxa1 family membrane protein insertase [Oscillospiraceae bacterium]
MFKIFDLINIPLGYLFRFLYQMLNNYGWTLVAFTVITKLILLPLTIKQQKSMSKMQAIQPRLQELQKKYQYDQEKLNQETMKLYKDNNVSPMGGCLPLLIQFPLLIALYNIIRSPLTYVMQLGQNGGPSIAEIAEVMNAAGANVSVNDQINIASKIGEFIPQLTQKFGEINILNINFSFFGLDLSQTPSLTALAPLTLIPILAGLTTFLSSWLSNKMSGQNASAGADNKQSTMKMMTYLFPLMTVFFAVSLPAGLGFYWILSNIIQIAQQFILHRMFPPVSSEGSVQKHFREREAEKIEKKKSISGNNIKSKSPKGEKHE